MMRSFIVEAENRPFFSEALIRSAQRKRVPITDSPVQAMSDEKPRPKIVFSALPPLDGCVVWCSEAETPSVSAEIARAKAAFTLPNPPEAAVVVHIRSDGISRTHHILVTADGDIVCYPYLVDLMRGLTERMGDHLAEGN